MPILRPRKSIPLLGRVALVFLAVLAISMIENAISEPGALPEGPVRILGTIAMIIAGAWIWHATSPKDKN